MIKIKKQLLDQVKKIEPKLYLHLLDIPLMLNRTQVSKDEEYSRNQTYMEQFKDIVRFNWVSEIPEAYIKESIRDLQINFVGFMKLTNNFY